jgi:hypothetical protein
VFPRQQVAQLTRHPLHLPPEHAPPSQDEHVPWEPHWLLFIVVTQACVAGSQHAVVPHSCVLHWHCPFSQYWPVPQSVVLPGPQRQPLGPGTQWSAPPQFWQLAPAPMRQLRTSTARQRPVPSQQPSGQLVVSQMHAPPEHRRPGGQGAPVPQRQTPDTLQRSELIGAHCV